MIVGYARVSTKAQNLSLQLDALKSANCDVIYSEKISGTAQSRPELEKCLETLKPGDTLIVWRLDRLGRSLRELINTVAKLGERKVVLKSVRENINTSTSLGKMVFNIFALMSEYERDLIKERVLAAREAAALRGLSFGRPKKLNSDDLDEIEQLRASGFSMAQVAAFKNVSRATLYRRLQTR
jgi:DNA invertase Pin-like site-specific DNA recombinase